MAFGSEINQGNIIENWLFDFANDNSGYLRFSFNDTTDSSNFYHGVILNNPSIRDSIDLSTSTAKSSNISISIPDFKYNGSPVSQEIFGGSNHYINQTVSVYSKVGSGTKQQIGSFRLIDISSDGNTIRFSLTSHRPWDFITFPQEKTATTNQYIPIAYGSYSGNTYAEKVTDMEKTLYPVPILRVADPSILYITANAITGTTPHHYEPQLDAFIPINTSNRTADTHNNSNKYDSNANIGELDLTLKRAFKTRPVSITGTDNHDSGSDTLLLHSTSTQGMSYSGQGSKTTNFNFPLISGKFNELVMLAKAVMSIFGSPSGTSFQSIKIVGTNANEVTIANANNATNSNPVSTSTQRTDIANIDGYHNVDISNLVTSANNFTIPTFGIKTQVQNSGGFGATGTTSDLLIHYDVENDFTTDGKAKASYKELEKLKHLYIGNNGLTNSWDSSAITEIHEAHRDLIIRFAGVTTSTPEGWSDLDSSKDWAIRYWKLEPSELKKELEKLQYEGGFIFRFKADGSPQYIHIKDTYSDNDISATITKNDISNVTVKPSSFSELLTQMDINYEKHPAQDRYSTSVSSKNQTSRTNWAILSKENIKEVNLDAYVSPTVPTSPSSNPNDDFYTYYDNIFGDIKLIVTFNIVNPKHYNLEIGDIINFTDMYPETPYGYNSSNWSNLKFMIVSVQRTVGKLNIIAREIG